MKTKYESPKVEVQLFNENDIVVNLASSRELPEHVVELDY